MTFEDFYLGRAMCSGACNGECGCERFPRPPSLDANIALWRFRRARFRLLASQPDELESASSPSGPSPSITEGQGFKCAHGEAV
jgi:hypothetical protein